MITRWQGKAYSDCDICRWNKTHQSCRKENMERYVNDWRCQVDEKVRQCWSYPQEKHVIKQLFPTLRNLDRHILPLIYKGQKEKNSKSHYSQQKEVPLTGKISTCQARAN